MIVFILFIVNMSVWFSRVSAFPEEGKWQWVFDENISEFSVPKSLFAGTQIFIQIICKADSSDSKVTISWSISESVCWNDYSFLETNKKLIDPGGTRSSKNLTAIAAQEITTNCSNLITLKETEFFGGKGPPSRVMKVSSNGNPVLKNEPYETENLKEERRMNLKEDFSHEEKNAIQNLKKTVLNSSPPFFVVPRDGFYLLVLKIKGSTFKADAHIDIIGQNGYLSAGDWPFLPFYGIMCLVYVIFGLAWLIVSFCQWRELLRIQFWIGAVILLGMLEKATFYAEYQNINLTGVNVKALVLLAEWVSCAKRTLARMLVIIVSLGFGIVKPRLGSMLHRLICIGTCYFILALVESYIRVVHPKNYPSNQLLIASIPLAVLDSAISWWIFTALIQTMRTLRLRRNLVKLSLYRHFTNTLVFAILASVVFMLYSIKVHRLPLCVTDWKNLWVDEAYWHILFSVILLVIMILWRPTNNNQRYAFTPLLDAAEDDEEEDDLFVNDAYGVKMRIHSRPTSPNAKPSIDDDILKWVDENIPSAGVETALPIFDSEEEILTTKYEVSKMQ